MGYFHPCQYDFISSVTVLNDVTPCKARDIIVVFGSYNNIVGFATELDNKEIKNHVFTIVVKNFALFQGLQPPTMGSVTQIINMTKIILS